ncbi:MAG: hypothetical protein HKO83_15715 [Ignavibacteriaceae bacterium]|nr:hypothetical protein [Ignavibacteriaceae bacterium]
MKAIIEKMQNKVNEIRRRRKKFHCIMYDAYKGETKEQAVEQFKKNNKVMPEDDFIFIAVVDEKMILEEREANKLNKNPYKNQPK